ncbi:hypothetical protein P3B99_000290 [Opitutia bacterium KCR 482]|nr:hypothetical protein [Opitutae bacterium KCR 482]
MKKIHIYGKYTLIALSFAACQVFAKPYATLDGDTLKIGNDEIERTFEYNGGDLRTLSVLDKKSGISTRSTAKSPTWRYRRKTATRGTATSKRATWRIRT